MANNFFRFKQFTVRQENAAMKVGTDGVLLGAWADTTDANTILDIGTGTGLIAIMLAQRSQAKIDAVEIDTPSFYQAKDNIAKCPWSNRISLFNISFQDFSKQHRGTYDLIVSNPPYFIKSLKSTETSRNSARHNEELPQDDLVEGVNQLLTNEGTFSAIFPYIEGNIFVAKAAAKGLFCSKRVNVTGKQGTGVKRLLLEFSKRKFPYEESELTIRNVDDGFTPEYKLLTKDFYLAF
ncbi:MAG TPA: methyltransferase [Tenuifilaceae bacterium]|nr:methyltransferase [Tenuifilaceae bacterium]HPJ44563.1 methyltransferase [Tenuifilaceae bacterium]HPQ34870.1 methyltransferase [Tenuifilaceae bacterium]HRX67645.1 methyltransferase [Tenuifilaceae bacterium]